MRANNAKAEQELEGLRGELDAKAAACAMLEERACAAEGLLEAARGEGEASGAKIAGSEEAAGAAGGRAAGGDGEARPAVRGAEQLAPPNHLEAAPAPQLADASAPEESVPAVAAELALAAEHAPAERARATKFCPVSRNSCLSRQLATRRRKSLLK